MLFWIIVAVLVLTPLVVHLRGGSIVSLSLSVAAIYGAGFLVLRLLILLPGSHVWIARHLVPASRTDLTTLHDTYFVAPDLSVLLIIAACFGGIALVFWALARWQAPLAFDVLRTLFWLFHSAILALPIAAATFLSAGMPADYLDGSSGVSVFVITNGIVNMLILISLGGFTLAALWAVIKRLRM